MPTTSTEDTIIGSPTVQSGSGLYLDSSNSVPERIDAEDSVLERCRALFRNLGRRASSFDLSRQIYG